MQQDPLIEIRDAVVYRGDTKVFDRLCLEIRRDDHTAILGPNGAGKTTLLKLLSRELYPVPADGAYVRIFGRERWNVWQLRAHLGLISNDLQHEYLGHVSGVEVILSGLYSSIGTYRHQHFAEQDLHRAETVMLELDIAELRDQAFAAMSTGQQRRLLLGRAMINDPDTLVLDEPTSGLDLKASFRYLNTVRRLMRRGVTLVLVTHHIHEIPPEVNQVILMKDGAIVDQGDKAEVLTADKLSRLYDTPVELLQGGGYYQAVPATNSD